MSTPDTPITPETLKTLIASVAAEREAADGRVSALEASLVEQQRLRDALADEERAYRASLLRRFPQTSGSTPATPAPTKTADPSSDETDLADISRTEAVSLAVKELSAGTSLASPASIEGYLRSHGRTDDRDQIGGVLAYLNRKGRVESPGRAQWRWVSD